MIVQWLAAIVTAVWISPLTWIGATSQVHIHLLCSHFGRRGNFAAGGHARVVATLATNESFRDWDGRLNLDVSIADSLLSGGRIETHFSYFRLVGVSRGFLPGLASHRVGRAWSSLWTHMLRGIYWARIGFRGDNLAFMAAGWNMPVGSCSKIRC